MVLEEQEDGFSSPPRRTSSSPPPASCPSSSSSSRKYWSNTARERNRRHAREEIRRRIDAKGNGGSSGCGHGASACADSSSSSSLLIAGSTGGSTPPVRSISGVGGGLVIVPSPDPTETAASPQWIRSALISVVKNRLCFFSLTTMQKFARECEMPFPTELLYEDSKKSEGRARGEEMVLVGQEQLMSYQKIKRFGEEGIDGFLQDFRCNSNKMTFYEYAVWLQRPAVVAQLLLGGINPCVRDVQQPVSSDEREGELRAFGYVLLKRFHSGKVPLPLSSYAVTRVLEMRRQARNQRRTSRSTHGSCSVCRLEDDFLLRFHRDGEAAAIAGHGVCELCLWKDILRRIETQTEESHGRNVVACPVCGCPEDDGEDRARSETVAGCNIITAIEAHRRYAESRKMYLALPSDPKELFKLENMKKLSRHQRRRSKEMVLCSSWSAAVLPKVGFCQEIRREKFFSHTEDGNYHYVKSCIDSGIDLNLQNEYGQTALFIASWKGYESIVELLLGCGADPEILSNGGLGALGAATEKDHDGVVRLLLAYNTEEATNEAKCSRSVLMSTESFTGNSGHLPSQLRVTTLIDESVQHPGAGSYVIDDAISDESVDAIVNLWKVLPEATEVKQKSGPCSVRSYFCDVEGVLTSFLAKIISIAFDATSEKKQYFVLDHMRFLHYSESGLVLPPHTDLCRLDPESGERSTHTFILYLADCEEGGATSLLEDTNGPGRDVVLARVRPKRKRLLLFPHLCPHEGEKVIDVPKLLVRGEAILSH